MGKGSKRRTQQISDEQMKKNWERIFNKNKSQPPGAKNEDRNTRASGTQKARP